MFQIFLNVLQINVLLLILKGTLALRLCAAYILWSRYYSRINFFTIPAEQTCHGKILYLRSCI